LRVFFKKKQRFINFFKKEINRKIQGGQDSWSQLRENSINHISLKVSIIYIKKKRKKKKEKKKKRMRFFFFFKKK